MENWQTALFKTEKIDEPIVHINLHMCDALPEMNGQLLQETRETKLLLDGTMLWQETFDRKDGAPMIRACYPTGEKGTIEVWALRNYLPHTARSWVLFSALDLPYALLQHDLLTMHSSAVKYEGKSIIFVAASGTGKSTQAELWRTYRGAEVLNGDKNLIGVRNGIAFSFGTPFSGTSEICVDYELPIGAIVMLKQAPENTVIRLKGMRAVQGILENCFGHVRAPGCLAQLSAAAIAVASRVPIYELACTPDERAVKALEHALKGE